jgi:hypothetical protein
MRRPGGDLPAEERSHNHDHVSLTGFSKRNSKWYNRLGSALAELRGDTKIKIRNNIQVEKRGFGGF